MHVESFRVVLSQMHYNVIRIKIYREKRMRAVSPFSCYPLESRPQNFSAAVVAEGYADDSAERNTEECLRC